MKKLFKLTLVLMFTFLLVGCKSNNISKISYESFKEKIDKKESLILFFGESDILENTLNNVLNEYDLKAYKIKVSSLDDDQLLELKSIIDYEEPSICFIKDGVNPTILTNITDEYVREETIINTLKNLEFIKEKN